MAVAFTKVWEMIEVVIGNWRSLPGYLKTHIFIPGGIDPFKFNSMGNLREMPVLIIYWQHGI